MPPSSSSPFDFISAISKLRQNGLGAILDTFGLGRDGSQNSSPSSSPQPTQGTPGPLPGEPDFAGRLPFQSGYTGLSGQPSDGDGLISFHSNRGYAPPAMIENEDGLLVENPMHKAFKVQKQAAQDAADAEESQALYDSISEGVARKKARSAAEDQESAARSAYASQQSEAEFQALASQRTRRTTPTRGGYLRMGRRPGRG